MPRSAKFGLLFLLLVTCWVIAVHGVGDIGMYYSIAGYVEAGEFNRVYGVNAGVGRFFYGPLSLVLFSWMPRLSYENVRIAWIILNTVAYGFFWFGLYRLFPFLAKAKWLWVLVWISSIKSIHASFQSHNVQLMIAALLVWCEILTFHPSRSLRFLSGWLPTLAGQVKVFPFFISLFALLRGSRLIGYGIVIGTLLGALCPLVYFGLANGFVLYQTFVSNLGNFHDYAPLTKDAVTLSLASLIATWFSPFIGMQWCLLLSKIASFVIGASFLVFVWRNRKDADLRRRTHLFSLAVAVMALINSSTRPDYFIFFVPAFASLAEVWQERRLSVVGKAGTLTALALIDFISEWTLQSRDLNHQLELMRLPVVGMILLCLVLFSVIRRDAAQNVVTGNILNHQTA